jgi:phosphoesterase RecJ-like protein
MISIEETAAWLKEKDNFLILTHRRPDGDTLGSAGALACGLFEQGKTAYVLFNPEVTPRYARFVEDFWAPDGFTADYVITIDTASCDLFPKNGAEYIDSVSLCIDHHPSNTDYAEYTCLDSSCASCGEIIYEILMTMYGRISAKSAECMYAALSTDTGCFAYANTNAAALRVAALLIEAGAPHREINRTFFRTRSRGRIKIEGMIFSGLEFHFDGRVAIAKITRAMMDDADVTEDCIDDIASIPGSIEGVLAGITLRELTSERDCKASVRTSPSVNAHAICSRFGGGGHAMAAGFSKESTISEIKEELLAKISEFLPIQ